MFFTTYFFLSLIALTGNFISRQEFGYKRDGEQMCKTPSEEVTDPAGLCPGFCVAEVRGAVAGIGTSVIAAVLPGIQVAATILPGAL